MISITTENIKSRYQFFRTVCIEETLKYLKDKLPHETNVNIIAVSDYNHFMVESTGGALCDARYNKDVLICDIFISDNIYGFNQIFYPGETDRRETFLTSLDVPIDKCSLFLIVLLHELGHANLIKLFHDAGIIDDYSIFDSLSESVSKLFERRRATLQKWEDRYNSNNLSQIVNGIESQCDIFARDNFLPLWKIISKILKNYTIDPNKLD
jgi:hypothetical protein